MDRLGKGMSYLERGNVEESDQSIIDHALMLPACSSCLLTKTFFLSHFSARQFILEKTHGMNMPDGFPLMLPKRQLLS